MPCHDQCRPGSRTIYYAPVWIAEQNGYFQDEGVDARFEVFDNAEKINEAMHAGPMQIAIASVEALVADAFKGGKFRIVASVAQQPPHFIIAQPEIKTVHRLARQTFRRAVAARGHHLFRAGPRKGHRLQARRHRHRCGRRRADALEAVARGQDRRRPAAVPAQLESEAAGFSNLGPISKEVPDYEFTAVFLDPAWGSQQAGGHGLPARAAARPGRDGRRSGQGCGGPGQGACTTPDYARRAIGDALKFKLMPDGLAASEAGMRRVFTTLQRAGLVPNDAAIRHGPVRRSELSRGGAIAIPTSCASCSKVRAQRSRNKGC